MHIRLGYFVPEFPGQTHIFFWREIAALEDQGVQVDIVSTRQPVAQIISHTWSPEAKRRTTYLFPPVQNLPGTLLELLRCGPLRWWRCLQSVEKAKVDSLSQRARLLALVLIGAELACIARRHRWKHLHVHSCANAANIALFAHLLSDLPYSLALHGPLEDYEANQEQKWQNAQFCIVITHKLYQEVHQQLANNVPDQVLVAPMGVDTAKFYRQSTYRPWNGDTPLRIFSCGRLNYCKGHADLIRAVANLHSRGIGVELKIAGEDEQGGTGYHKELEALVEKLGLVNTVHFLGAVSEAVIQESLEKAHVFALASLHEPLGVAIMEAMAMELPVIATREGGVKELIKDGVDGILVDANAPGQLSDAIVRLMQNPSLAVCLGQAGMKKVRQQFHSRRSADVIVQAFTASPQKRVPVAVDSVEMSLADQRM